MAKSVLQNLGLMIVFLLSLVADHSDAVDSASSLIIELNIAIAEELPVGTVVADLAADAGLNSVDSDVDALQFYFLSGTFDRYFSIGRDAAQTSHTTGHLLTVKNTLDREVVCYGRLAPYSVITVVSYVYHRITH